MSNPKSCRICLQEIHEDAKCHLLNNDNELRLRSKLLEFYPQINLSITENPVSCIECTIMIDEIYQFKQICVQNEMILSTEQGLSPFEYATPKELQTSSTLMDELNQNDDSKPVTYKCVVCTFSTRNVTEFTLHWKNHPNISPKTKLNSNTYVCDVCDYKARTKGTLKQHRRLHTGEKSFKCKLCDYRGRQLSNLQSHMFKHTRNMPYRCKDCDYKTPYKAALLQHERLHTGEKPFKCKSCKYRGRQLSNLQLHMRTHHNG